MLGEDKVISGKDCWKLCVKDAILYLDEGNLEAYAEKLTKAYELAKAYDELPRGPIEYKAPLFDRLIVDDERREQEELLIGLLSDEKLCHAASADLRRRMVEETLEYRRLHPFWWKRYYDFCRKYISDDHFSNFGTEWHLSEEEIGNRFNRIKNLPHGHERLIRIYKEEIEKLITSGVMRGYVAELGETICAFCHCGPKESFEEYKCHEQMGVPPLPEGSKILSVVEFMVPWGLKGCGIEEKLLSLALKEAKELGFTHAEIYPLERMIIRDGQYFFDNIEMYKRLGFEIVFDMSTEDYGIDYVMQKKL